VHSAPGASGVHAVAEHWRVLPESAQQLPEAQSAFPVQRAPSLAQLLLHCLPPAGPQQVPDAQSVLEVQAWSLAKFGPNTHAPFLQMLPAWHSWAASKQLR
jgi:hypothetical protein